MIQPGLLDFAHTLTAWQEQYGRHDLPWQNTRDAYRIWLSEIMLQQTQVSMVIPYYRRFLDRFPTIGELAKTELDEILRYWSGLGYYSRARNLYRCARIIVSEYGGFFPTKQEVLATLPGIGRSTAAAIAVFSAGEKAAIMDGNVIRVLSRVFALTDSATDTAGKNRLWQFAETLLPDTKIERYTQGLMDLGATVCSRSNPKCPLCPFKNSCKAKQENLIAELPIKKMRKSLPSREIIMLIVVSGDHILLEKRPDKGVWGGLYSLPECPTSAGKTTAEAAGQYAGTFGSIHICKPLSPFVHIFTHFKLNITPCLVTLKKPSDPLAENQIWCGKKEALELGLPKPVRKIIGSIRNPNSLF